MIEPPLAVLAELTHRCPLQCPYCSNPVELERANSELSTAEWVRVMREIAEAGALQVHLSGGEPMARPDLDRIVAAARDAGLYSNLITSAVLLTEERMERLAGAGLDHVQISFQDSEPVRADRIAGYRGALAKKKRAAEVVRMCGLPLTVNLVVHRQNLANLEDLLAMAVDLLPQRIEVAHVQYYGWALRNRAALMPTPEQVRVALGTVEQVRERLKGRVAIDHVVPDYYGRRPKACMGGWGRRFLNITPSGKVLPCHAAESIPGLAFETVGERTIAEIWRDSSAFEAFRGTSWMPEPCRSCARREIDWGGCRCQALAITGDAAATDPVCDKSPDHDILAKLTADAEADDVSEFIYRGYRVRAGERRRARAGRNV